MASHDGASSSSSSSVSTFTHHVFLSFRGPDTGDSFTAFLHSHLKKEGVDAYMDREDLRAGEEIKSALFKAIQESKISIPVFSKGYADSKWCLIELVEIVRCHRDNGRIIVPIFFDVDPTDVRNQTGSFEASFVKHKDEFDEQTRNSWKEALKAVANNSGYHLGQVTGNQSKLVDLVVDRVLRESSGKRLDDVEHPVGLNARVKEVEDRLCIGSDGVQFVGIWGPGGIGKTAIAKTLYNRIFKSFRRSCFLANKGGEAFGPKGLVYLQEQLISSLSKWKIDENISNVHRGREVIIQKLQGENVLLVLDDVDSCSQLDAFAIESKWFGPRSRIVITTRDKHILKFAKVDEEKIYCPEDLDDEQSLQLFSLHAFSTDQPPERYLQPSVDVIHLAGGLPLTLKVLGSTFSDEDNREEEEWNSRLQELKRNHCNDEVYNQLRISYDNLKDHEKSIFLDAACFFVGWRKEIMISMWDACGFNTILAITRLTQRSLLKFIKKSTFGGTYELRMHDQIQAMGRRIVYEKSPEEPSKRSRIWSREEYLEAIEESEGAPTFEVILMRYSINQPRLCRSNFTMMSKLRLLDVYGLQSKGDFSDFPYLPPSLRWFTWNGSIVRDNFYHKKLVHMNLFCSQIGKAWTKKPQGKNQLFQKLKALHLQYCDASHESLDFSWFPSLETLDLRGCINMVNLHNSIGDLKSLVELNLRETEIKELPNEICSLSSLKVLILKGCSSLKNLPESIGDLTSLVDLDLGQTEIEKLPDSICNLSSLKVLVLKRCSSLKNMPELIGDLKSLVKLDLEETKIEEIPSNICKLKKLPNLISSHELVLSNAKNEEVPDGVSLLEKLEELTVRNCHNLVKLPISWARMRCLRIIDLTGTRILLSRDDFEILLPSLVELRIGNNLESSLPLWISDLPQLRHLYLRGYTKLESIRDLPSTLTSLTIVDCILLQTLPELSSPIRHLWVINCKSLKNTRRWKIHGQGTLLVEKSQGIDYCSLSNVNDGIHKGLVLCVVFEFFELRRKHDIVQEVQLVDISLITSVNIRCRQNKRRIHCRRNEVVIEGVEYTASKRDIIYVHHFEGFDWFGIPLELESNAIEVLSVLGEITSSKGEEIPIYCKVKFWKLSLESTASEQQQQITTIARRTVADFFNWSDDEDHGRSHHFVPTQQLGSSTHRTIHHFTSSSNALEIEGSNLAVPQQADEESSNEMIDSHNNLRLGLTDQGGGQVGRASEHQQQITSQEEESTTNTSRRMVANLFNWSDHEDHGRSHHFVPTQQVGSSTQAGRVAEDPNLSQQALGLLPERLWRAGKRARLDMDNTGPSGAY